MSDYEKFEVELIVGESPLGGGAAGVRIWWQEEGKWACGNDAEFAWAKTQAEAVRRLCAVHEVATPLEVLNAVADRLLRQHPGASVFVAKPQLAG